MQIKIRANMVCLTILIFIGFFAFSLNATAIRMPKLTIIMEYVGEDPIIKEGETIGKIELQSTEPNCESRSETKLVTKNKRYDFDLDPACKCTSFKLKVNCKGFKTVEKPIKLNGCGNQDITIKMEKNED